MLKRNVKTIVKTRYSQDECNLGVILKFVLANISIITQHYNNIL